MELEEKVGASPFLEAYSKTQRAASDKRHTRKRERAVEAVVEPEEAAKRKLARNREKTHQRKRKMENFKKGRGSFRGKKRRSV